MKYDFFSFPHEVTDSGDLGSDEGVRFGSSRREGSDGRGVVERAAEDGR